ncbi:alpha/beta hydrolase [Jeotgalibacillus proteolyticus]|uniref:Carboxylesterase n=1 Tax=Jeotgalibacillus proteolyticus TaxID=2082395 RepID=A0A2S5GFS6_9BACL|nr:alpha/beta hydrolase [Jeotgalibacillus proteolyticus]PPA71846.1 carboxylesterase [Jeotgalibacillus proteolyticus]
MKHIFKEGSSKRPTLLLLHGTGGTENDLLSLGGLIDPEANILSVRGEVSENGMPRFFKRLREGVFDIEDLKLQTKKLNEFLDQASSEYGFERDNVVAVGYSNGANIAASLLFHYENALKGAVLHHPMVPIRGLDLPDSSAINVLITAGDNDPICPPEETTDLESLLKGAGAEVEVFWHSQGHQLTQEEAYHAKEWYNKTY